LSSIGGIAYASWTYFEVLQAPGLLHELLHEKAEIQLVGSGGFLARHPYPTNKTRARETGIPTRRLEIDAAQAWQGWDFRSRQTVLKTLVVVLGSEPAPFGPKPNGPLTVWKSAGSSFR
jgi:hypothetical protein